MKILISLSYYLPNISGLTIYVKNLAEELTKRGYHVHILTSQHQKNLLPQETIHRISVTHVPYLLRIGKGLLMPAYLSHAFLCVKRSQVVVINLPQFEGSILAILAKLLGKRLFCIYHCEISLPKNLLNNIIEIFLDVSHLISLILADQIVTNTKDFADSSKLLRYFSKKIIYIYPPIRIPTVNKISRRNLLMKFSNNRTYTIGAMSRVAEDKGIEYLLKAIPLLKEGLKANFIILLAGPKHPIGEGGYWNRIAPLVKKYEKYIHFVGILKFHEIGAFYSLLDVLVLPSINSTESFGMVQVEAMLCGTPVVASNLPGVRIPVQKTGMGELTKPKSSPDLANNIVKILQNKKLYIKKQADIEKRFSLQNTIKTYERLLFTL